MIKPQATDYLNSPSHSQQHCELIDGKNIYDATEKVTPVDADRMGIINSAASNVLYWVSWANIKATLKSYFMPIIYPIGSIYINATDSTNPATLLGFGTWTAFGAGRVPVGFDAGQVEFDTAEETGGAKTVSIAHVHQKGPNLTNVAPVADIYVVGDGNNTLGMSANETPSIVQPYIVVYMWKRTA